MRLAILVPVLLGASLTWACGQPAPNGSADAGQVGVKAEACGDDCMDCSLGLDEAPPPETAAATPAEAGPAAELMTVRLSVMGMG